jgi:hypothetical protein
MRLPLLEPICLFVVRILILQHGIQLIIYLIFLELIERGDLFQLRIEIVGEELIGVFGVSV